MLVPEHPPVPMYTFKELEVAGATHSQFVPSEVVRPVIATELISVVEETPTVVGPAIAPGPEMLKDTGFAEKVSCALADVG